MKFPRRNITRQFITYLMLVSVIPLLIIGVTSYRISYNALLEEASRYTSALVVGQKDYLEAQLAQIEALIANLSGVEQITTALDNPATIADTYADLATQARIGYILNGYSNLKGLVSIDIFSLHGQHYHVGDTLNANTINEELVNQLLAAADHHTGSVYWSGIEDNVNLNSTHRKVIAAAKVLTKTDRQNLQRKSLGLLLVNYSVEELYDHFSAIDLGKNAWLMVVDNQHRVLYHPDRTLLGGTVNDAYMARLHTTVASVTDTINGQQMSISHAHSQLTGWTVLGLVPLDTLTARAAVIGTATALTMVLCFALVIPASWSFNHTVVAPIRALTERFKRLQQGTLDLDTRLPVRGGDEISELSHWFNEFMAVLAARQRSEQALREIHEQLEHNALHDALTGLPNRTLLMDRLRNAVESRKRFENRHFAVLFLDLDHFKFVNDSLGHSAGDQFLIAIARRLESTVRTVDTVARLGGDEFVILLDQLPDFHYVNDVAERVLECLAVPFDIDGQEIITSASIGIALSSTDYQQHEHLLRDADTAMYRAKAQGKARYEFFDTIMREQMMARLALETDLRHVLERQELELHFQPILAFSDGGIVSLETLLRWRHPRLGLLPPGEFIPLIEENGLIVPIGVWVLREACKQVRHWQDAGFDDLGIAVNISPRQFLQTGIVDTVMAALSDSGLSARCLMLEITENLLMQNVDTAVSTMHALNRLGVRLAIDDFGTGYSSLAYLKRFPIDQLKIDHTFVRNITTDADDTTIIQAVIALARSLRLQVVAEGVETASQHAFLESSGCDEFQGYYFSPPLPAKELDALLHRHAGLCHQR